MSLMLMYFSFDNDDTKSSRRDAENFLNFSFKIIAQFR